MVNKPPKKHSKYSEKPNSGSGLYRRKMKKVDKRKGKKL
jgi:hypothetical protein